MKTFAHITPNNGKLQYEYAPLYNLKTKEPGYQPMSSEKLNFDLNHPVEMEPEYSYDGSTNIVLTDDKNPPRLINSRFKVKENGTYEIPYRLGVKPENIYDDEHFDVSTQLQRISITIPRILLKNIIHPGNLKVGNYVFYIKYVDGDGNESDFVAESGVISCFIGSNNRPKTIQGGYRDLNSHKSIILRLENLDTSYNALSIYYSRDTSDEDGNRVTFYRKLVLSKEYHSTNANIKISGDEEVNEITEIEIWKKFQMIDSAKTMALCLNMLFFGNIKAPEDDVKELKDIGLRFLPYLHVEDTNSLIGEVSTKDYSTNKGGYYNIHNIYNYVGYWDEEIYRFGIVFVYNNGRTSNVYDIRGINELPLEDTSVYQTFPFKISDGVDDSIRNYIEYDNLECTVNDSNIENCRGVFRINVGNCTPNIVRSVGISCSPEVIDYLPKLGIRGFFFVRQKRIPTILAQTVILNVTGGKGLFVNVPVLPTEKGPQIERFLDDSGTLTQDYNERLLPLSTVSSTYFAGLCPDYNLDEAYYNQLFVGDSLPTKVIGTSKFLQDERHFYLKSINLVNSKHSSMKIVGIPDNTNTMGIDKLPFKGVVGSGEEAYKNGCIYKKVSIKFKEWKPLKKTRKFKRKHSYFVRGIYGPYLGIKANGVSVGDVVNIYIPDYSVNNISEYFKLRYLDKSHFFAISDRFDLKDVSIVNDKLRFDGKPIHLYRGDCFFSTYTHRLNRNFRDPDTPNNSTIVDNETWRKYFNTDAAHTDVLVNINRSDINAVALGSWFTFTVCSSSNLNLRTQDLTYPDEKTLSGYYRGFYPNRAINANSDQALPESFILNKGYGATVGNKIQLSAGNDIYNESYYANRIIYSEPRVRTNESFTNAYRTFSIGNFNDYDLERGSITKLIEDDGNLYCIFEHGIAVIPVLEKLPITDESELVITSNLILPDKLTFVSTQFGSLWKDSIIKTNSGRIYGVDTVAKKIWMVYGNRIEIISDAVISSFLNKNINLTESDININIGIQNVKTHYNSFKEDVMFTFYKGDVIWNICYNDLKLMFTTFYSWVPLESQNVDNVFYSFDLYSLFDYNNQVERIKRNLDITLFNDLKTADNEQLEIIKANYEAKLNSIKEDFFSRLYNNKIYKHGFGGIIDTQELITPTKWYDKQHPFEFEVIVNDTPSAHKIFDNLRLISNKAKPESFHYEIIGECFDFTRDKPNAYYRQEAKKEMWNNQGSIVTYDHDYPDLKNSLRLCKKSIDFPLYYTINKRDFFWTTYNTLNEGSKDYRYLSGTELVHYPKFNEFRLNCHAPGIDLKDGGRLRGNMYYLEDFWNIQINPIVLVEKNEDTWEKGVPPITVFNAPSPNDLFNLKINNLDLPVLTYIENLNGDLEPSEYYPVDKYLWSKRKEIKLKDKWIKVRIRYSGEELALISALYTMYSISYA